MKHFFSVLAIMLLAFVLFLPYSYAHAEEGEKQESYVDKESNADFIETCSMGTISDYTFFSILEDYVLKVYLRLDATFLYDGNTATCISAGTTHNIYDDTWSCDYLICNHNGNQAWVNYSFSKITTSYTYSGTIGLSCNPSGIVTSY